MRWILPVLTVAVVACAGLSGPRVVGPVTLLSDDGNPLAGHGFYVDELFIALIAFGRLYLKADASTRARFEAAGCEPFVYDGKGKPVTMRYFTAPEDAMESPALMQPWARLALEAALRARAAK